MKKIHFFILVMSRFLTRYFRHPHHLRRNFLVAGAIIGLLVVIALKITLVSASRQDISEGLVGIYSEDNLPAAVTNLLSKPLVSLDKAGQPQPVLASGWQVNNNASKFTFKLKNNLYWNDGSRVKSGEIKFNLPDVDVSYPDEATIEFKLADSFDPFPTLLVSPVFKGKSLLGMGKYRVLTEEKNHNFITKLVLTPKDNALPKITIRFYPDETTAKTAFELGEVQSLVGLGNAEPMKNQPLIGQKWIAGGNKLVAVFYNTKDNVLSDKNMRKALSFAAPKIEGEEPAKTSIKSQSWVYNNELRTVTGDIETAKVYLKKVTGEKNTPLTLTTTPALSSVGEQIIRSWKQAGIEAVLRVESGVPQNFQAALLSEPIPLDPDQYLLWHSTQTKTNISKYSSPRADKDLEDGRKSSDLSTRREKYLDLQKVLQDDAPATFLYFPKTQVIYRKKAESSLEKVLHLQYPQN